MPVILNKIEEKYHLGIWKVEEDFDTLFSQVKLNDRDCNTLNSFQSHSRKIEWLSVRTLLKQMLNNDTGIYYDQRRKPYLEGNSKHISISHSNEITSVLISDHHKVGIDLEYMSHRIDKISDRFMSDKEYINCSKELVRYHLYIHWCAKEALYKICDKEGLNFKTNLIISPFEPADEGVINGKVIRERQNEEFILNYFKLNNYIVVWCLK